MHNGIEYGIMQLISEAYDVMKSALGMRAPEMAEVFAAWNRTELNSYLIEITAAVLARTDPETKQALVDVILDKAGQKGTGKWTSQNALDLGIAIPTINAALEGRILSGAKDERVAASKVLRGPAPRAVDGDRTAFIETLRKAMRLAIFTCYAQGFALMREASKEYNYHLHFSEIARSWKGGCIIRAKLLDGIKNAFAAQADLANLMVVEPFSAMVNELQAPLRTVVAAAAERGIPVLALAASLGYVDSYRLERLPANLLQGLRDYFGAHRYERIDRPRGTTFHTEWME
jgi:6-phosphogluconate dehydrogenase